MHERPIARLYLLGPLALIDGDGNICTPKGQPRRAILALAALSPRATISRAKLQDMLWTDKDSALASQNLRSNLYGLKRDLGPLAEELLAIDETSVALRTANLRIDVHQLDQPGQAAELQDRFGPSVPDLLEGLDVRSADDEFEDWLRHQRSYWHDRVDEVLHQATPGLPAPASSPEPSLPAALRRPVIGLLPPEIRSDNPQTHFIGDAVLDLLSGILGSVLMADITDLRLGSGFGREPGLVGTQPAIYLRIGVYQYRGRTAIRLLVLTGKSCQLIWSATTELTETSDLSFDNPELAGFISQNIDRICDTLDKLSDKDASIIISPFHAIMEMFRLDHSALDQLRTTLRHAYRETNNSIYLSIIAYLNTFTVGEHWKSFTQDVVEETADLTAQVEAEQNWNGIALALAGHAKGYVLHDMIGAERMLKRSVDMAPYMAICWDHLALHSLYTAHFDDARRSSEMAERLGRNSPLAFTYETTRCMIDTLQGHFEDAREHGLSVLSRRPNYGAALRYTSVSLAHLGAIDEARNMIGRIRDMDPSFSSEWVSRNRMAVNDENGRLILLQGLERAGG